MLKVKKKYFSLLFLFLFFCFPSRIVAQETLKNIGFLTKNIWYSKTPFFDKDLIRIYTIINNSAKEDVIGKILFYSNKKIIGSSDFSASNGGSGVIVWTDWQVAYGEQIISAKISEAKIAKKDGTFINVILENSESSIDSLDVDFDTDKDGIGNKEDNDDDNDGLLDEEELSLGLDPLNPDTDQDGVIDSIDIKPKDINISKQASSTEVSFIQEPKKRQEAFSNQEPLNFASGAKKFQEEIIPVIKKSSGEINQFFEEKEKELKLKKEKIEEIPEVKNFKEIRERIFSSEKEERDNGISEFKKWLEEKKEKKNIAEWIFLNFLILLLEKRVIIFYLFFILLFLFLIKYFKKHK